MTLARSAMGIVLRHVSEGRITVVERDRVRAFGPVDSDLRAIVTINDSAAWSGPLRGGLGLGGGYVDGHWDTDDLVSLIRIAARELRSLDGVRGAVARPRGWLDRVRKAVPANTNRRARENITAHYDLGNDLFEAFLDERMMYSCAIFEREGESLEEAQTRRLDRICKRLGLGPEHHLLEIGTGWGGLALHAARSTGCRVTTTTISREQADLARERIGAAGLSDRITVIEEDYRNLKGTYDRLVSIEMIEAVGWQYFDAFFAKCSSLLEPDGAMLLQAITIDDRLYEAEKAAKSFANTHIFPGGCLPSMQVIADHVARATDMRQVWMDDITASYPPTLAAWRERFLAAWEDLRAGGYDERFRRLWVFYLSFVEAGFIERRLGDVQILLAKPEWTGGRPDGTAAERREADLVSLQIAYGRPRLSSSSDLLRVAELHLLRAALAGRPDAVLDAGGDRALTLVALGPLDRRERGQVHVLAEVPPDRR